MKKISIFCLLSAHLCFHTIAENLTLSSNFGAIVVEVEDVNSGIVDQLFWENFATLFPNYYFSGTTVSAFRISPTHFYYRLNEPKVARPSCHVKEDGCYHCPYCPKKDVSIDTNMYDHIRQHLGIAYHCSVCGYSCKFRTGFNYHKKAHYK